MGHQPSAEQVRRYYDAHAADYDRQMRFVERRVLGAHRGWATSQASGDVLELAVGTGLNLPLYPAAVRKIVGVDLSEQMLARARQRVSAARLAGCHLQRADVASLGWAADGSFDTVLSTYSLCALPDPGPALREARRLLRPSGRLVLVEHGPARSRLARGVQRLVNPLSVRLQADDLLRDPLRLAREAGFDVVHCERAGLGGAVYRVLAVKPPPADLSPGAALCRAARSAVDLAAGHAYRG